MTIEDVARVCHEANRAYCEALGDYSQVAWDDAPDWQRESAINGVLAKIEEPDLGPEESHENWMLEKIEGGWSWGPEKDVDAKTHPCLVPYRELPEAQKRKDWLFLGVVFALMGEIE